MIYDVFFAVCKWKVLSDCFASQSVHQFCGHVHSESFFFLHYTCNAELLPNLLKGFFFLKTVTLITTVYA